MVYGDVASVAREFFETEILLVGDSIICLSNVSNLNYDIVFE